MLFYHIFLPKQLHWCYFVIYFCQSIYIGVTIGVILLPYMMLIHSVYTYIYDSLRESMFSNWRSNEEVSVVDVGGGAPEIK